MDLSRIKDLSLKSLKPQNHINPLDTPKSLSMRLALMKRIKRVDSGYKVLVHAKI